ncbi:hypothetical protein ACWGNN_20760 [Streptomyces sp. NPDC055817]
MISSTTSRLQPANTQEDDGEQPSRVLGQSSGDAAGVEEAQVGGWLQEELGRPAGAAADAGFIVEDRA